jgi:hypothetical protein
MDDKPEFYGQRLRDAHALAIGKIVMAWNEYQEKLGEIYAELHGHERWRSSLVEWHAVKNDAQQRSMLVEIARATLPPESRALAAITWMVQKTDDLLREQRNIGVHMPLMSFTSEDGNHQMLPLTHLGNPKASVMVGRDLLKDYASFENRIRKMLGYSFAIGHNVSPVRVDDEVAELPNAPTAASRGVDGQAPNLPTKC